jgi:N-acetylglucosaminyl-diphospho-decaprenol L-rhamnosyltransferase
MSVFQKSNVTASTIPRIMNIATVIVTHDSAAHVADTLAALREQLREGDQLVVVDNASSDGTPAAVRSAAPDARLIEPDGNLGFGGGCNAGAEQTSAPLLLFLNPDAVPAPGCIEALRAAAEERPDWGAWQALVTMDDGSTINTSGGVTHYLGLGWAGRCGEPVSSAPGAPTEIAFPSGAALCIRRDAWEHVGGFDERYFLYVEDLDLGLRLWLSGYGVGLVPEARVEHAYEFGKGQRKWMLLERNRWWTVLSDYPAALLLPLLPALLATELALLVVAARGGWLRAKLSAQAAVVRELPQILARRRQVQALRAVSGAQLAERLSTSLDNPYLGDVARVPAVVFLQRSYWMLVRALLRLLSGSGPTRP